MFNTDYHSSGYSINELQNEILVKFTPQCQFENGRIDKQEQATYNSMRCVSKLWNEVFNSQAAQLFAKFGLDAYDLQAMNQKNAECLSLGLENYDFDALDAFHKGNPCGVKEPAFFKLVKNKITEGKFETVSNHYLPLLIPSLKESALKLIEFSKKRKLEEAFPANPAYRNPVKKRLIWPKEEKSEVSSGEN